MYHLEVSFFDFFFCPLPLVRAYGYHKASEFLFHGRSLRLLEPWGFRLKDMPVIPPGCCFLTVLPIHFRFLRFNCVLISSVLIMLRRFMLLVIWFWDVFWWLPVTFVWWYPILTRFRFNTTDLISHNAWNIFNFFWIFVSFSVVNCSRLSATLLPLYCRYSKSFLHIGLLTTVA